MNQQDRERIWKLCQAIRDIPGYGGMKRTREPYAIVLLAHFRELKTALYDACLQLSSADPREFHNELKMLKGIIQEIRKESGWE